MRAILNGRHIELSFAFDPSIIDVVKTIAGRRWEPNKKVWTVPATSWHMQKIVELLAPLGFAVDDEISKGANDKAPMPKMEFPEGLWPFQRDGVRFLYRAGGRAILADEMGLGKTITTLAFMKMFCGKTLVVCPATATYMWENRVKEWIPDFTTQVVQKGKDELKSVDVLIMSYAMMVSHYQELSTFGFDVVVFDEAHYLKGRKTQRGRAGKGLVKGGIPKVLMLSGTPFLNRPDELFPLANMIDPAAFPNFYDYAKRYMGAEYIDGIWYFPPGVVQNREELAERLSKIMIRRTKKEVALDLPDLTRTTIPIDIANTSDYKNALLDLKKWAKENSGKPIDTARKLVRLATLRQVVGLGKVDAAIELAEGVLHSERKVVLFAHHKSVVAELEKALKDYGVRTIVGDTTQKERSQNVKDFLMEDSSIRVMICSAAGSEAIDLFSASDIIMVERQWTPAREEQMEARLHRMGQKNPVTAYYLVAKGTVDEKLDKVVRMKREVIGKVISQDEIVEEIWSMLEDK